MSKWLENHSAMSFHHPVTGEELQGGVHIFKVSSFFKPNCQSQVKPLHKKKQLFQWVMWVVSSKEYTICYDLVSTIAGQQKTICSDYGEARLRGGYSCVYFTICSWQQHHGTSKQQCPTRSLVAYQSFLTHSCLHLVWAGICNSTDSVCRIRNDVILWHP